MTKKDYIKLAELIKYETHNLCDELNEGEINSYWLHKDNFINGLCRILREDNPRFDKDKFILVCK